MRPGDAIHIRALKANGQPYRWWLAEVESRDAHHVATLTHVGDVVNGVPHGWVYRHHARYFYWFERPYNLTEVYEPDGRLKQLYVHIASPAVLDGVTLAYIDHELDVILRPGQPVRIADKDEFDAAAGVFGYTPEFQDACWRAVDEALNLVSSWKPLGWTDLVSGTKTRRARGRRRSDGRA